jgi:TPR repeat protein
MYHLGIACYEGNGVRQSNSLALKWLIEANKDDDFPAARAAIDLITGKK